MAFLQNGTWVPDQPVNSGAPMASAMQPMQQNMMRQGVPQVSQQPQMAQNQMQLQPQMLSNQMPQVMPQYMTTNPNMMAMLGSQPAPVQNPVQPMQAAQQGGILPNGPPDPGMVQMINRNMQPQYQQPMPQPQSVMQSVNNNNPQSVQNFLQALHQSGMSGSNGWQNPQGIQGQGPQAGFQGFQQNGNPQPQQNTQWSGYQQGQQPQLGGYANQARQGGQVSTQNAQGQNYQNNQPGVSTQQGSQGGTGGAQPLGGVQGQLPYRTPGQESMGNMYQQNQKAAIDNSLRAASDVNSKTNILPAEDELNDFLNNLNAYSYEYKDPKYGDGRRISPMAQEIEQSSLGKAAISTNAEGYKIVDYGKLSGTTLAAVAYNHHELKEQRAALALLNHKYSQLESELKEAIMANVKSKGKK